MVLETTECIIIDNNGKIYTDCMEFSLLRFIHMLHYEPSDLSFFGYSNYKNNENCKDYLLDYMKKYPLIYSNAKYYLKEDGTTERNEWATLVSDKDFLDYYRNDKAELFTSVENIINFFNGFYNMNLDTNNQQLSLNSIAEYFTTENKKISLKINNISKNQIRLYMSDFMCYISRPETEYCLDDPTIYKVIDSKTSIYIKINDDEYLWMLSEMYICDSKTHKNKYITGHSVIHTLGCE
jgi:hypothetical protein